MHCSSEFQSGFPFSLEALELVDAPSEPSFDNLTALAQQLLRAPVALVSLVQFEKDRQYFKSHQGLPEPWATTRQTRGFIRSLIRLITPPFPAASRPSKTTTTRKPRCLIQRCITANSTCNLRSSFS